jgi:uncharacterized protein YndB with AHSA1/START domain
MSDHKTSIRSWGGPANRGEKNGRHLQHYSRDLVLTDAYNSAWEPSGKPFMTAILTFEDAGVGTTRCTALVKHWSAEDREAHVKMGFHEGWGMCADQLEQLARTI